MKRKGVSYDVGTTFPYGAHTRPRFSPNVVRRELQIIAQDLHCTSVKIGGTDLDRLRTAAAYGLEAGLEVWVQPALVEKPPAETLRHILEGARIAERFRSDAPDRVVLCVGQEFSLFLQGILPGKSVTQRFAHPDTRTIVKTGKHNAPLNAFLGKAAEAVRPVFHGPIAYAALPWEGVDWRPFDLVGVDHYWDERVRDRYLEMLRPFFESGKPVVVTGTGSRAYRGAHSTGTLGFGVVDYRSQFLHGLPVVGWFVRPKLKGDYVRDEEAQARHLVMALGLLDTAGVDGVFLDSFVDPIAPYSEDPRHDLDMSSLALVKTYEHRHGSVYPDMTWEPKAAFRAVAEYYAAPSRRVERPVGSQPLG